MKKNLNKVLALTLAFTVVGSTAAYAEVMKGETTATPVPISAEADDQAEASAYILSLIHILYKGYCQRAWTAPAHLQ